MDRSLLPGYVIPQIRGYIRNSKETWLSEETSAKISLKIK
jgi:hypothetical protein